MIIGTANGLERLDKCSVSTPYLMPMVSLELATPGLQTQCPSH